MITIDVGGDNCVIRVSGALTVYSAFELRERVIHAFRRSVVVEVDLAEVEMTDDVGANLIDMFGAIASPMFHVVLPARQSLRKTGEWGGPAEVALDGALHRQHPRAA